MNLMQYIRIIILLSLDKYTYSLQSLIIIYALFNIAPDPITINVRGPLQHV